MTAEAVCCVSGKPDIEGTIRLAAGTVEYRSGVNDRQAGRQTDRQTCEQGQHTASKLLKAHEVTKDSLPKSH
jgi:hypothetical protein